MDKNIRIAKEILRMAKAVAASGEFDMPAQKVQTAGAFDKATEDVQTAGKEAGLFDRQQQDVKKMKKQVTMSQIKGMVAKAIGEYKMDGGLHIETTDSTNGLLYSYKITIYNDRYGSGYGNGSLQGDRISVTVNQYTGGQLRGHEIGFILRLYFDDAAIEKGQFKMTFEEGSVKRCLEDNDYAPIYVQDARKYPKEHTIKNIKDTVDEWVTGLQDAYVNAVAEYMKKQPDIEFIDDSGSTNQ